MILFGDYYPDKYPFKLEDGFEKTREIVTNHVSKMMNDGVIKVDFKVKFSQWEIKNKFKTI